MSKEQRVVFYSGSVQGVGFRYTTCRVAGRFNVAGTVRNLPDGKVEVVAEGERKEIDAFLAAVEEEMGRHIRDKAQHSREHTGRYADFRVAY